MKKKAKRVDATLRSWPTAEEALAEFLSEWSSSAEADLSAPREVCARVFQRFLVEEQLARRPFGPEELPDLCVRYLRECVSCFVPFAASRMAWARRFVRALTRWLAQRGMAAKRDPVKELHDPNRERALKILRSNKDSPGLFERFEYIQGFYWVAAVREEGIWLEAPDREDSPIGPIPIHRDALALFQEDWGIYCSLARIHDGWRLCRVDEIIG